MKNLYIIILIIYSYGCRDKETIKLENYLKSFNLNIYDYKVICIIPVDGCGSCINPSLYYARESNEDFLLVLSSMYKKSIDYTIDRLQINNKIYISDCNNLAMKKNLVSAYDPCYYLVRYGEVVRKLDLAQTKNKKSNIYQVDQFIKDERIKY